MFTDMHLLNLLVGVHIFIRPRSATAVTPSKDKKKKKGGGGGGGARTNMPAIPDNMADNFLATLKRK